jgi:hypothetical protein
MVETVSTIVRVMSRGGGFPSLVETSSGAHAILKLSGVGQGAAGLLTELVATRLAGALGLRVPRVMPLMLRKAHPWETGTDEFYDALQRSAGWNLGVEYIDQAHDIASSDLGELPADFLDRLAGIDALLQNVDRTTQNPNVLRDREGRYWAIDFGACLFLDRFARDGSRMTFALPKSHFLAGRRVPRLALENPSALLRDLISDVPEPWLAGFGGRGGGLLQKLDELVDVYLHSRI